MDVVIDADCGNAPRKVQVRDWLVALESGDTTSVHALLVDDIEWEYVGVGVRRGREEVTAGVRNAPARSLRIHSLLSHGKQVAAEGHCVRAGGDEVRFAHIVTFSGNGKSARIRSVVTYEVDWPT